MSCSIRISVTSGGSAEQELGEALALAPREAGRGLVEHHQPGLDRARHPDLELALLAVREIADERVRLGAEPRPARPPRRARSRSPASPRLRNTPEAAAVVPDEREEDVVDDGETGKEARLLVRPREPERSGATRAGRFVTSWPTTSIVPAVGGKSPATRLKSVVLPAPFGPRIARRSPCATSRSTSRTAWTPPKRRPTPRKRRIGSALVGCCLRSPDLLDDLVRDDAVLDDLDLALPGQVSSSRTAAACGRAPGSSS